MSYLSRTISFVGGQYLIALLGAVYVAFVPLYMAVLHPGDPLAVSLVQIVLISIPGLILLYGAYWLPRSTIHESVYPRIVCWCFGGLSILLSAVLLLVYNPSVSVDHPVQAVMIAAAIGSTGGFGLGLYNARAIVEAANAKQRSREAEQYSAELERKNDRMESFAGMLAHELRNPLTIAQIYHQQERPDNEEAAKEVENALDRIEEMVDILLVTVRESEVEIDSEPVAIAEVAVDAWSEVTENMDLGADLVVEAEQMVTADPVHLEHLIRNLYRNSLEHGSDDVTVRVGDLDDGFFIEDNGPGIPEEAREDVVEAGFTTKADGIGLGLTFVVQLADVYGWEWTITESSLGGTRFEFTGVDVISSTEGMPQS